MAFSGGFVSQDPSDEPASALIERRAGQRTTVASVAPTRRARKSKA